MATYQKPIITVDSGMAEGIYAASGCYTVTYQMHQEQQLGRTDYRIQVNGEHKADHTRDTQFLTVIFNQAVEYVSSTGTCESSTPTTLTIKFTYHQNPNDHIGLGDLVVTSEQGLQILSMKLTD